MFILGGGVAGLAASLASGAPVYEAGSTVGGVAQSRTVDGFTFDHGIHVLQTQNPTIHRLFQDLDIGLCTKERQAMIYSHKTHTPYPFQINTIGLPLGLRLRCLWKYFRRGRSGPPTNYQEWIYDNIGEGYGDTFLIPYSEKFWTVHPREMTHDWTNNRIPPSSTRQMLSGAFIKAQTNVGTNAVFEYPERHGFGAIPDGMGRALGNVYLDHRATGIDVRRRCVQFNGGTLEVEYDAIISTLPLPTLVSLIPDAPADIREAVQLLRHNSIVVVNLGIDNPRLSDWHWVHYPEKDVCFYRISYPHNFGLGMVPTGMSSVSAEVSYSDHQPIDKSTVVDRVIADLVRVGAIGRNDRIVVKDVMDIKYGYVIYDRNRKTAVRRIREWLESLGVTTTGRYGLWAYLWSHESILSGWQAGRRFAPAECTERIPELSGQLPASAN
jgi:protoporphyrinogen oxidase